jgi:hypothetical protein
MRAVVSCRRPERIGVRGDISVAVHDVASGRLLETRQVKNLVVTAGRNLLRDLLRGINTAPTHVAVGTGTAAVQASDAALAIEVHRNTITQRVSDTGQLTIKFFLPSGAANGQTLAEAGIFNAAAGGDMLSRVTYAGIAKTASITVTYTWTISFIAS